MKDIFMKRHLQAIGNQHVHEQTKRDIFLVGCSFLALLNLILYYTVILYLIYTHTAFSYC